MKKVILFVLALSCALSLLGCNEEVPVVGIVVDGVFYEKSPQPIPAEIDPSAIIGYIESYTDAIPTNNGEQNISEDVIGEPIARVVDGIVIKVQHEWYLCKANPTE